MSYNEAEKYILVLSHDEVVHLKCSMLNKMPGLGKDKFRNLLVGYAFFMGHPGKKLLFMGQDFAQLREWSEERELDWFLLAEDSHRQVQDFYKELLHIYRKYPAMYELDHSWAVFSVLCARAKMVRETCCSSAISRRSKGMTTASAFRQGACIS